MLVVVKHGRDEKREAVFFSIHMLIETGKECAEKSFQIPKTYEMYLHSVQVVLDTI